MRQMDKVLFFLILKMNFKNKAVTILNSGITIIFDMSIIKID